MSSLIIKDLLSQAKYLGLIFLLFVGFSFNAGTPGEIFASIGLIMAGTRLAFVEEKNNTLLLLKTMPLKASTVVMSKYWAELIFGLVFIVLGVPVDLFINGRGIAGLVALLAVVSVAWIFSGLLLMLFFKWGYLKASNYLRIGFIVFFMICMLPVFSTKIKSGLILIAQHFPLTWMTGLLAEVLVLVLYFSCAWAATKFYQQRENI